MKERPILFSAPMVRAILAGTKSQTRRIAKGAPADAVEVVPSLLAHTGDLWDFRRNLDNPIALRCPYGAPGDRLWVREAFAYSVKDPDSFKNDEYTEEQYDIVYRATSEDTGEWTHYDDEGNQTRIAPPWRPGIHMPRWASRITLEVTGVRVERLHAITEEGARAEGVESDMDRLRSLSHLRGSDAVRAVPSKLATAKDEFAALWREINGAESWDANPWVWVVSFRRLEAAERAA